MSIQNKGTNVTSDSFPKPGEENISDAEFPSLHRVKNQLQNVIDVIGTGTPQFMYTNSMSGADADEESIISSTSIISSVLQFKHTNKNRDQSTITPLTTPRDVSELSYLNEGETCDTAANDLFREKSKPLCVPAVLPPAVLCMNPSCLCTHSFGYMQKTAVPYQTRQENVNAINRPCTHQNPKPHKEKKMKLSHFIDKIKNRNREIKSECLQHPSMELYKMNIMQAADNEGSPPKRFVFDLIKGTQKPDTNTVGINTERMHNNRIICMKEEAKGPNKSNTHEGIDTCNCTGRTFLQNGIVNEDRLQSAIYKNPTERHKFNIKHQKDTTKVDVYYFDHGNAAYYCTTDSPPVILSELVAEKTENYATKFWAEFFGTVYIGAAFFTSFILQLLRFILYSVIRPLTVGVLQLISDYLFKPFLAVLFNAVVQPPLIFCYNVATSLRDLCDPLAKGVGYFLREMAVLCRAVRLFEIKQEKPAVKCDKP